MKPLYFLKWGLFIILGGLLNSFLWGQSPIPAADSQKTKEITVPELVIAEQKKPFSILSQLDIQSRPIQSSQEVLRMVPGLFIAQHAGGGKSEQIFLRGFDIDHGTDISLSVDGLPVNMVSHAHGQGYADLHFLIPELIERVTYGKGPFDPQQGNFATAGYVDFQTPYRLKSNSLKVSAGQFNTYRGLLKANLFTEKNPNQAYVATEYTFSEGYFENPQDLHRLNVFGKYSRWLSPNTRVKASAAFFTSRWDASGQIPQRAVESGQISRWGAIDPTEGGNTQRAHLELGLSHLFPNQGLLEAQAYLINYDFSLFSNFTFFLNDPENGDQIWQAESRSIQGLKLNYKQQGRLGSLPRTSRGGVQLRYDRVKDNLLARTLNRDSVLQYLSRGDVNELNVSAYWEEILELSKKWELSLGLRYDGFRLAYANALTPGGTEQQTFQAQLNPKLKLSYQALPNLKLYLHSGTGFHSNDSRLFLSQRESPLPFLPRAYGLDLGVIAKPARSLLLQAALWGLDLEQEFVYVGDEGIVEAGGRTRRLGIETSLRWQPTSWLFADTDATYSFARARDEDSGQNYLPLAPRFTCTAGLGVHLFKNFNLNLRYRMLSDRPANEDFSIVADGYQLIDLRANYRWKFLSWSLSIENLLNQSWEEAQFATTSRLPDESSPVTEIHFTPGSPFFARLAMEVNF